MILITDIEYKEITEPGVIRYITQPKFDKQSFYSEDGISPDDIYETEVIKPVIFSDKDGNLHYIGVSKKARELLKVPIEAFLNLEDKVKHLTCDNECLKSDTTMTHVALDRTKNENVKLREKLQRLQQRNWWQRLLNKDV